MRALRNAGKLHRDPRHIETDLAVLQAGERVAKLLRDQNARAAEGADGGHRLQLREAAGRRARLSARRDPRGATLRSGRGHLDAPVRYPRGS